MKKRLVCCTSTGCISYAPERYKNLGIEFFNIIVNYGGKDYLEGLELNPYDFFKTLETLENPKENLPHSAIPTTESITKKYESMVERGIEEVFIVALSSYLGGTYNAIRLVGEEFKDKLDVHVIDAKTTGFGEGLLAIQIQELVNKGVDTETILKEVNWSINHQEFLGTCEKLDYLIYNGRLKGGKAFMGKLLKICPVMHFSHEGVLEAFDQTIGIKKGTQMVINKLKEIIGDRNPDDYLLWHNYTGEGSMDLLKEMEKEAGIKCNHEDVIMSPVIGCHTGPFLSGYGLFMKRREDEPLE